jgi:hypothetical protein
LVHPIGGNYAQWVAMSDDQRTPGVCEALLK